MKTISEILGEIKARCEKATPGPWDVVCTRELSAISTPDGFIGRDIERIADQRFTAHAREDVPRLVEALQVAESALHGDDYSHDVRDNAMREIQAILAGEKG
jgi:hypothetical protein